MTPSDLETAPERDLEDLENDYLDEVPGDVEMSLFDHLEELRRRIFYSLIALLVCVLGCFAVAKPIVQLLEAPAQGVKFLQLAPGEYFFVTMKVAGYTGLLLASPFILYQIIQFVLPGLTRRERRMLGPVIFGSSILFFIGLAFAGFALIPTVLKFFMSYGADVVDLYLSIDRYFEFLLPLMLISGLLFQIPIILLILGNFNFITSQQMLSRWREIVVIALFVAAVVTPSTDPFTQSLLAAAILGLYFGGIGLVKLSGK